MPAIFLQSGEVTRKYITCRVKTPTTQFIVNIGATAETCAIFYHSNNERRQDIPRYDRWSSLLLRGSCVLLLPLHLQPTHLH